MEEEQQQQGCQIKGKRTKRRYNAPSSFCTSSSSSGGFPSCSDEEEQDMAECLILLAQGHPPFVYECKTCSRVFASFQALGGHRASHKKPRNLASPETVSPSHNQEARASLPRGGGGGKIHECSICGSEFSSGQALGGHMRRHRAPQPIGILPPAPSESDDKNSKRVVLKLDLNLPAPEEERCDSNYQFLSSVPSMVDCHY